MNFRYSIDSTPDGANATPVGWQSLTSQSVTVDSDLAADDTVEFNLSGLTGNTNYVVQSSLDNSFPVGEFAEDRFRTASVKPGTPTGLELVPGELSKLTLRWEAPDDGGTPITSYRVHWAFADAPSVDSGDFEVTGNPPPLSYEFATIGDQTTYEAWVFAINLHGDGPQSAVVRGMASQVPGEPSPVHVSALDSGINVRWGDAPGRGSDVTDYVIQWKKSTESFDDAQEANAEKTEDGVILLFYEIMGLENGTTYDVRVMGMNSNGRGVPSPWKSAIPVGSIGVPTGVTLTAGNGTIAVEWQPPTTGDTPTGYTVEWKRNSDTQWSSSPDATSPHTISGLTNGTSYNARVFAVVGSNEGEPSLPVSTIPNTIPDAPSNVRISPADSSLVVSWPAPFDGGSQITGYIVQWTESGGAFGTNENTTTGLRYAITGLTNGEEYDVRVIAENDNGSSGPSDVVKGTPTESVTPPPPPPPPPPSQTPGAPSSVVVTPGDEELLVTWFAPSNDGGSQVTGYVVQWTESGGTFGANERTTTSLRYTITGLTNGNEYDVRVIAVNANGRGTPSDAASRTPTTELVTSISAVSVPEEDITDTEAKVTVSIANTDGASLDVYLRYRTTTPEGRWSETQEEPTSADSVEFALADLTANTEYEAQASLENTFPEDASPSTTFTTTSTVPGAPQNVAATPGGAELVVTWEAPEDGGGSPVTGYIVQWKSGDEEFDTEREEQVDGETLTYTISDLDTDIEYTVQVLASNENGSGAPSETATGTPLAVVGSMIDAVSVESDGPTTAKVTVTVSNATEDEPVTVQMRYRIASESNGGEGGSAGQPEIEQVGTSQQAEPGEWSEIQSVETTTGIAEFTLTDLVQDEEYEIQVSLEQTFSDDAFVSGITFTPARIPDAPTGVALTPGDAEISVSWSPPADDGGSPITENIVQWKSGDEEFDSTRQAQVDVEDLMYTIEGLTNGVEYDVQVTAVNVVGEGQPSAVESATPTAAAVTTIAQVRILNVLQTSATAEITVANRDTSVTTTVYIRYRATTTQQAWNSITPVNAVTHSGVHS